MCEILDGADGCQFLLQCDDFKGQVAGRQDQDAHAGENSREQCRRNLVHKVLKDELFTAEVMQSALVGLNKWLMDLQKQVDDQQGGDGHWFQTAAACRDV